MGLRDGESIAVALIDMLDVLEKGLECNYNAVVYGYSKLETKMSLTNHAGKMIFKKSMYMKQFVMNVLKSYVERGEFNASHIAEDTIQEIADACNIAPFCKTIKSSRVVLRWFREFRDNGRQFLVHSIMNELSSKQKLPPFLELHHELKDAIIEYGIANLDTCSISMMTRFINKCIYIIVEKEKEFYNLENVDDSSDGPDAVDHDEDKAQSENLIVDDGLVVRGYNLVEEFSKVMMGLSNKEPTKVPKKVTKKMTEKNGRPSLIKKIG